MQLIIFVQPFLPGGTMSGLGVCQSVVEMFSSSEAHSSHLVDDADIQQNVNYQDNNKHHSHHAMTVVSSHHLLSDTTSAPPVPAQVDHHFSHLSCGFCILFGHAIPPPALAPVWLFSLNRFFITLSAFALHPESVILTDYIKPKSRAPPITI